MLLSACLKSRTHWRPIVCSPDEASNVDINKCGHEVLAVESVHNPTMTRDSVGKILKGQRRAALNTIWREQVDRHQQFCKYRIFYMYTHTTQYTVCSVEIQNDLQLTSQTWATPSRLQQTDSGAQVSFINTLILKALLKPLAKNPPKGPTMEAKLERAMLWIWNG